MLFLYFSGNYYVLDKKVFQILPQKLNLGEMVKSYEGKMG